ncbi:MAG: c-type cytochrome [Fimbriimonadales bacterium]
MRLHRNLIALSALVVASIAFLTGCGNQSPPATNGTADTTAKPAETKPAQTKSEAVQDPEAAKGKLVFLQTGCNACHMNSAVGDQYPDLRGLYGSEVKLADGTTVIADEEYLRTAILNPNKQVVAGYAPSMPPYGYLKEEQVNQLIAYIKSLKDEKPEFKKE